MKKKYYEVKIILLLLLVIGIFIVLFMFKQNEKSCNILTVQFGWIPDAHQAGFWTALDKDYYKSAGLNVKLLPGGIDSNPINYVLTGSADIGQVGGIEQLLVPISEGKPLHLLAVIHKDTPHALISLERNPIKTPKDLPGKKIAVAYGDAAEILLNNYLKVNNIKKEDIKIVPFKFNLTPLIHGEVDAVTGFLTDQPATLMSKGLKPVVLRYSDMGIKSYGYSLVCTNNENSKRKKDFELFINASRKGWQYCFDHPEESVNILKKYFGDKINTKIEIEKIKRLRPLMCDESGSLLKWNADKDVIINVIKYLKGAKQINNEYKLEKFW